MSGLIHGQCRRMSLQQRRSTRIMNQCPDRPFAHAPQHRVVEVLRLRAGPAPSFPKLLRPATHPFAVVVNELLNVGVT